LTGTVVDVTNATGKVTGHRIRFTRETCAGIETYAGAIDHTDLDASEDGYLWITGEYSVKPKLKPNKGCFLPAQEVGPLPFTGVIDLTYNG
jgi:hypothetical protein